MLSTYNLTYKAFKKFGGLDHILELHIFLLAKLKDRVKTT